MSYFAKADTASLLLLASVASSTSSWADASKQSLATAHAPSATLFHKFTGLPMVGISQDGNIVTFEAPPGYEHIGIGAIGEGYVLCYGSSGHVWDTGTSESGFGTSTASCKGSSCTITRKTADGVLQLTQVIHTGKLDRSANITMTLRNLTSAPLANVILRRQADFDVDTGGRLGTGDFTNWFASDSREMATAWNEPSREPQANSMSINPEGFTPTFAKVTNDILDNTCSPVNIAEDGPVHGDFGVTLEWDFGTLAKGASQIVTVVYRRN